MSIFDDTRAQRQHYRDEACCAIDVVDAAHSRPRIKVKRGFTFIVDLAHGIASDTFTIGPVEVFRGKGAREGVAEAAKSEDGFAAISASAGAKKPGFLNDFIGKALAKADLVPVAETEHNGGFMDVVGEGGVRLRFNDVFWTALTAISDGVLVDVDWRRPAMFLKDDTVIGLLMGLVPPSARAEVKP